ncbi:MAG: bifunctional oligoribonuclease/PAP phosphatase NrnA [bacterium]|nr:bifunctional oligoribonuclease/PAP phosphatase NrnA [bacterium]
MSYTISPEIKEKSALILAEIKKSKSVLLHCHPSPDPDSVGSALAMKFAIEQLGGKATVIKGDSDIPTAFSYFPGVSEIVSKNFQEIDTSEFDLFIIQDSALGGVSRITSAIIPETMKVINIDHHRTNSGDGSINLVVPTYPATAQLLFDIFKEMNVTITPEIAVNLFLGIFTDTGGFKYEGTTTETFQVASELAKINPNFSQIISKMENSSTFDNMRFQGLALSSLEQFFDGRVVLSVVPYSEIVKHNIAPGSFSAGFISSILNRIATTDIVGALIEFEPNQFRMSFRAHDSEKFDVSKLAASLGGGGHKLAAGAVVSAPAKDAKELVVEKIKELYNL